MSLKLNIGAGNVRVDGWTPIDRKLGTEAFPLNYPDNSVDVVRASHVLEHLTFRDAQTALQEWIRVLKPGGKLQVAVPSIDKLHLVEPDERVFVLMGGQKDDDDVHKSAWDQNRLHAHLEHFGLTQIKQFESEIEDCAKLPCSLNLEGIKPVIGQPKQATVKVGAYCTHPRYEAVASRNVMEAAFKHLKMDFTCTQGVFWGQCMQRMFQDAVDKNLDWILSVDSDSLFTAEQVRHLMDVFHAHPEIDALCALQCRRGAPYPLLTIGKQEDAVQEINGLPFKVTTAHFGLTLFRVDKLRTVKKPWFFGQPEDSGNWGDDRLDDDIWFWHQWRLAGNNIYCAPSCSIGHLEETVAVFDDQCQPKHIYLHEWRQQHGLEPKK